MKILRKLKILFSKITEKKSKDTSFYNHIEELPVWNWNKIHETGNLNYLYINQDKYKFDIFKSSLEDIWLDLLQQYFDRYGLPQKLARKFKLKKRLISIRCQFILTGDRSLLNEIALLEADLAMISPSKSKKGMDFNKFMWELRLRSGFSDLDPKKMSVVDHMDLIDRLNEREKAKENG